MRAWRRRFAHYLRHGYPLGNCPTCTWTYPNTGARYNGS